MKLKKIPFDLTVCKIKSISDINLNSDFYFINKTDDELSLVCKTNDTPSDTNARDDGWRGFHIEGMLDFSLIGILSKISAILADNQISIFAVSTYNTDYFLVKAKYFDKALSVLITEGYDIL